MAFSAWKIAGILADYREGESSYSSLEQYVSFETSAPVRLPESTEKPAAAEGVEPGEASRVEEEEDDTLWPEVNFEELAAINPDVVGWIYVEGTNINYPVVQGENNRVYLRRLFDGRSNAAGSIFLDAANSMDFSDPHSIIYGHRMNDKSMFYTLESFRKQEFYDEYNVALLITPTYRYKIRLFSVQIANNNENAWELGFVDVDFAQWLEEVSDKSIVSSEYKPGEDDRIITLSTCTRDFYLAKLLVHGYVERAFENPES